MSLLITWLITSIAVYVTALILPGFQVKNFASAILVAAIFGLLNALLGWLLFGVFAIATLGIAWLLGFITRWIINAILLKLTDALTDHLTIKGFGNALLGALIISIVSTASTWLLGGLLG